MTVHKTLLPGIRALPFLISQWWAYRGCSESQSPSEFPLGCSCRADPGPVRRQICLLGEPRLGPNFWFPHVSASAWLAGSGFKGACAFYPCANESCKKPFPAFIVHKIPFHTNSALVKHSCKMKAEMYKACPVCFH